MKSVKYSLLVVSGLSENETTNGQIVKECKRVFNIDDDEIVSMDLRGFNSIREAVRGIEARTARLTGKIIAAGHSAGARILADHFADDPRVCHILAICPPPHNPFHYPLFLWAATTKYILKLFFCKSFVLDKETSRKLFGQALMDHHSMPVFPGMARAINFGFFAGNWGTRNTSAKREKVLIVACDGDKLVLAKHVEAEAMRIGQRFYLLRHINHLPQIGFLATRNMRILIEEMKKMLEIQNEV